MPSPADLYLSRASLVYYAQLGETSGNIVDSKNANSGTASNLIYANVDGAVPGSKAPTFNGTTSDISVSDSAALDVADTWTVSCWCKRGASGSGQSVVASKNANAWQLAYDWANTRYTINVDSQGGDLWFSGAVNDQLWHHVFASKSGATHVMCIDGVSSITEGVNVASLSNAFEMRIGSNQGVNSWWVGSLQHLAIYSTALTAADARLDYEQGLFRPRSLVRAFAPYMLH